MMFADDELPWLDCLGGFDEESCRYFLHDVGKRVVPYYPFSFGMEEVYTLIVDKYGFRGCADAIAILQELLEDQQNAEGAGDDGDIWRSWRHGWRHRNDDRSNPYIPRVGNRILPAPSSSRIRHLRAENFVRYQSTARVSSDNLGGGPIPEYRSQVRETYASLLDATKTFEIDTPCLSTREARQYSMTPEIEENRTIKERFASPKIENRNNRFSGVPSPLRPRKHLYRGLRTSDSQLLALRGGDFRGVDPFCKRSSLDSLGRYPGPANSPPRHQISPSRLRADSAPLTNVLHHPSNEGRITDRIADKQDHRTSNTTSEGAIISRESPEEFSSLEQRSNTVNDIGVPTADSLSKNASTSAENRQRVANRQARLVDGTIFTSRTKRLHNINHSNIDQGPDPQVAAQLSSATPSSPLIKQKNSRRLSWLRGLQDILRHEKPEFSCTTRQKHQSVPSHRPRLSKPENMIHSPMSRQEKISGSVDTKKSRTKFGFDGAADNTSSCSSGVNVNKPLPPNPEDVVRSMSSRTSAMSPAASYKPTSSTASMASSKFSGDSIKHDSRLPGTEAMGSVTRGSHELPPIEERIADESSCDPAKSSGYPSSPSVYSTFAAQSPWDGETIPISPIGTAHLLPFRAINYSDSTNRQQGLPLSHSEPQLQYATTYAKHSLEPLPLKLAQHSYGQQSKSTKPRGRVQNSRPAHTHELQEPPKTLKRSRSPVKRLLGFGKSESSNTITANVKHSTPKTPKTPTSKKSSVRTWGDRLRYGFLTADQEQIRQEDLIEQHMNDFETPPSQKSTFPVSLEPPHQAKAHSEMELIITVTANRFLLKEARAGRLSAESVSQLKEHWHSMGRPQVIEFHYDQLTQHNLIVSNLKTIKLHGDAAKSPLQINSTLHGWKIMAKEMSVRTLCDPDSVIRKHLHDGHRVLELLGAPFVTFLAYDDMQVKTLARISARQKDRMARKGGSAHSRSYSDGSRTTSASAAHRNFSDGTQDFQYTAESFQMDKINLAPSPTPTPRMKPRKPTGAENAIMSLPLQVSMPRIRPHDPRVSDHYDASRGGRLGKMMQEKPEDMLL